MGIQALIETVQEYTEFQIMMSNWSWRPENVIAGESVGMCVKLAEISDAYASCWAFTKDKNEEFEKARSFLVEPQTLTPSAHLEDMKTLNGFFMPGMKGQWMCNSPSKILGRIQVSCARFTPKTFTI